ncbi:MAG: CheR family methyltransferase [bacterium]|nr:CheR family methyltransferase [bacterium]
MRTELNKQEFERFQEFISKNSGIYIDNSNLDSLRIALIARITRDMCFKDFNDYYNFLKFHPKGKEEFNELLSLITITETYFFREPNQFDALKDYIIPEIVNEKKERELRIWSAGCSTGEEPYTIAMILRDAFRFKDWKIEILATDVNNRALEIAAKGVYSQRSIRKAPKRYIEKYFEQENDRYRLRDEIRDMVTFRYFNLIKEPYPLSIMGAWDVIFCRNVTIYFKKESTQRVIHNFFQSLNPGGYLFVGHSESLYHIPNKFQVVKLGQAFIYRKEKLELEAYYKREDTEEIYKKAINYYKAEDFDKAILELNRCLAFNRNDDRVHFTLARVYTDKGRFEQAVEECKKALEINPLSGKAHFLLGIIYKKKGLMYQAIDELKKAAMLDPEFPLTHFNLASIYGNIGDHREACSEYNSAIKLLEKRPKNEVLDFSGGFINGILIEACKRGLKRLR